MADNRRSSRRQLAALTQAWLAAQRSAHTRAAYELDFDRFVRWCDAAEVIPQRATPADVSEYVRTTARRDAARNATIARRLSAVSSFFAFAVGTRAVAANPVRAIDRRPAVSGRSPTPTLTAAETGHILDAADRLDPRTACLVALLALDGLKLGEALDVDVTDVDGEPPHVRLSVRRHDLPVVVDLHHRTATAVAAQRRQRRTGPLLTSASPTRRGGGRLTRFGAAHLLKQVAAAAGLDMPLSANMLRRSLVTNALDEGRSLRSIQSQLGHGDPRTTRRLGRGTAAAGPR